MPMHKLSMVSLVALLVVGGVLAFVVFVGPHLTAAQSPTQQAGPHTTTSTSTSTTSTTGTNSSLLTQPPTSTGGDDGGSGFDD
jgi:hypothetical protein